MSRNDHGRDRRRALRDQQTPSERLFWQAVRNRRLGGFKFRRQHSIGPFVVDFCCIEARLVVELDGAVHTDPLRATWDATRDQELEAAGFLIVRIQNDDLHTSAAGITDYLLELLQSRT
ncbi:hypothetical protein BH23BAC4_BH23BAC4_01050 [soil metagenome]